MLAYLYAGAGLAIAASIGFNMYQSAEIDSLEASLRIEKIELAACGARLSNLVEDLQSDNAIDALPDSALVDVPPHWLLEPPTD